MPPYASGINAAKYPDAVIAWARDEMANYKVPRRIEVVDALPLNAAGKVLKYELRERAVRTATFWLLFFTYLLQLYVMAVINVNTTAFADPDPGLLFTADDHLAAEAARALAAERFADDPTDEEFRELLFDMAYDTAAVLGFIARRIGLPAVVGYLMVGLVGFQLLPEGSRPDEEFVRLLADVGVVLLLFEVGIELDVGRLRREHRSLLLASPLQIITSALLAGAALTLKLVPRRELRVSVTDALGNPVQAWVRALHTPACGGWSTLSASDALRLTIG